mgnify:CR=1 FL=1
MFYATPLVIQIYLQDPTIELFCIASCVLVQLQLTALEGIQIYKSGPGEYLADVWNNLDLLMIALNFGYFAKKLVNLASGNYDYELVSYTMIILNTVMVVFCFLKIMFFLRVFEQFG